MKIQIDPMPRLRAAAEDKINVHFNGVAVASTHIDQEHALKRKLAEQHLKSSSDAFRAVAAVEGKQADALAREIVLMPDAVLDRGLLRRQAILAIREAETVAAVNSVLNSVIVYGNYK